jgi:hypothetical protein
MVEGSELEVVTMGRVSVDLYPEQIGVPLAEVRTFNKSLGGSATNVAVAAARLGRRTAVVTKVGDDGFGEYVRIALEGFGVYSGWVGTDPVLRTPLAGSLPAPLLQGAEGAGLEPDPGRLRQRGGERGTPALDDRRRAPRRILSRPG